MKRLLDLLTGRSPKPPEPEDLTAPFPGRIFAFVTSPYTEFSAPDTGRQAAFKVIGVDHRYVAIAVLDGVWFTTPTLREVRRARTLRSNRFDYDGRPTVVGIDLAAWQLDTLREVRLIGLSSLTAEDCLHADQIAGIKVGASYSSLVYADMAAEGEWRWAHDREALVAEHARVLEHAEAARNAKEARYRDRLRKLTWDQLLSETPFAHWSPSPPYPPPEFAQAARAVIHEACRELQALGPKPRKADVRRVLRHCIDWFNAEDERAGGVIETEEREDIMEAMEELSFVARQKSLSDEMDDWREW